MFTEKYASVFDGDETWQKIDFKPSQTYQFDNTSTYIQNPPFFNNLNAKTDKDITNARILALFGDNITTDHITSWCNIKESPAALYLNNQDIAVRFSSTWFKTW